MSAQFERLGLDFVFLNGINFDVAEGYPSNYNRKKRWRLSGKDLTPGEIGCLMSHRLAWQSFLESSDEYCCVIEDDVFIEPEFEGITKQLTNIADHWDVVRLYGSPYKNLPPRLGVKLKRFSDQHYLIDYFKQPGGGQGYVLKRSSATCLLDYTKCFFDAIDNMIDYDWAHGLRVYGIEPRLVYELEGSVTTISGRIKIKRSLSLKLYVEINRIPTAVKTGFFTALKRLKYRLKSAEMNR